MRFRFLGVQRPLFCAVLSLLAFGALNLTRPASAQEPELVPQFLPIKEGGTVAVSPDGKMALVSSYSGDTAVWDIDNKRVTYHLTTMVGANVAFAPDGKSALASNEDSLALLDVKSWATKTTVDRGFLAYFPDSSKILARHGDSAWYVLDAASGRELFEGDIAGAAQSGAVSPDGKVIAVGDAEGQIVLYDAKTYALLREFRGAFDWEKEGQVIKRSAGALVFSADSQLLFVAAQQERMASNGEVRIFDLQGIEKGRFGADIEGFEAHCLTRLSDGSILTTGRGWGEGAAPRLWKDNQWKTLDLGSNNRINDVAALPGNKMLVSVFPPNPRALIYDLNGTRLPPLLGAANAALDVALSPEGTTLYTVQEHDPGVDVVSWDTAHWTVRNSFAADGIRSTFSADARKIALTDAQWKLKVYDTSSGTLLGTAEDVRHCLFSPDGTQLWCLRRKDKAEVFTLDIASGAERDVVSLGVEKGPPVWGRFSPDGSSIIVLCAFNVTLFDRATGAQKWSSNAGGFDFLNQAFWTPDGKSFGLCSRERSIEIHDAATGELQRTLGKEMMASGVLVSPDGKTLWTRSRDEVAAIDLQTGEKRSLPVRGQNRGITIRGDRLFVASHTLQIRDLNGALQAEITLLPTPDFKANTRESVVRYANGKIGLSFGAIATGMLKWRVNGVLNDSPVGVANVEVSKSPPVMRPLAEVPTVGKEQYELHEGEIALEGILSGNFDRGNQIASIAVSKFTLPDGQSGLIKPEKIKEIFVTGATLLQIEGETLPCEMDEITVRGAHWYVIGQDGGNGQPLTARRIILLR